MAIQTVEAGLWTPQAPVPPRPAHDLAWRPGTPDVDEAVAVSLEMLTYLGGVTDANKEAVTEEVQTSFAEQADLGYDGRLRVVPSAENVPFNALTALAEGLRPSDVAEMWQWPNLWVPGTEAGSYTEADLNSSRAGVVAQLAVFNAQETGHDPVLHHTNLPYDQYAKDAWNPSAEITQLEAVAADKAEFEATHEGFEVTMTDHRAYLVDAIMDRIRGVVKPGSKEFILNQGFMRMPEEMGRRTVDGDSVVGLVGSDGGRLSLVGSVGRADPSEGVGLSVGKTEEVA